jgi:hypothetical protein
MFARVTLFEIDTLRISLDDALKKFQESIVPEIRKREGYEGICVMHTPEGKGLIITYWSSKEAVESGIESGYYDEQLSKFMAVFKAAPGREHYEVVFAEPPQIMSAE